MTVGRRSPASTTGSSPAPTATATAPSSARLPAPSPRPAISATTPSPAPSSSTPWRQAPCKPTSSAKTPPSAKPSSLPRPPTPPKTTATSCRSSTTPPAAPLTWSSSPPRTSPPNPSPVSTSPRASRSVSMATGSPTADHLEASHDLDGEHQPERRACPWRIRRRLLLVRGDQAPAGRGGHRHSGAEPADIAGGRRRAHSPRPDAASRARDSGGSFVRRHRHHRSRDSSRGGRAGVYRGAGSRRGRGLRGARRQVPSAAGQRRPGVLGRVRLPDRRRVPQRLRQRRGARPRGRAVRGAGTDIADPLPGPYDDGGLAVPAGLVRGLAPGSHDLTGAPAVPRRTHAGNDGRDRFRPPLADHSPGRGDPADHAGRPGRLTQLPRSGGG